MDKGRGKENNSDPIATVLSEGRKVSWRTEAEQGENITSEGMLDFKRETCVKY